MDNERFNDLGSEFDDLFDGDGASTVEPVESKETEPVDLPDSTDVDNEPTYGVEEPEGDDSNEPVSDESELDVWHQYLKEMGIADSKAIQFENDEGEIETVDFDTLDRETQLTMLRELSDPGLSEHEIEVVNYLRRNNVSFNDVIEHYAEQRLQQYLSENPDQVHQKTYSVDEYSNDELYLADLKNKYPTLTDEELLSELDSAKLNEELFNKKSEAIRQQYKEIEEQQIRDQELAEQQRYEALQQNITNAVLNFKEVSIDSDPDSEDWRGIEIEDGDRQSILSYLLDQDQEGKSQLVRDIEDPNSLIELAWYKLYGQDLVHNVTKYWKGVVKEDRKKIASLTKQVEKYKNGSNTVVSPVSEKKNNTNNNNKGFSLGNGWDDLL